LGGSKEEGVKVPAERISAKRLKIESVGIRPNRGKRRCCRGDKGCAQGKTEKKKSRPGAKSLEAGGLGDQLEKAEDPGERSSSKGGTRLCRPKTKKGGPKETCHRRGRAS